MNVIAVIRKISEIRLLQSQIKNDTELACDMDFLIFEDDPACDNWPKYLSRKLDSVNYFSIKSKSMTLKTQISRDL
jgi:hypothetical protein